MHQYAVIQETFLPNFKVWLVVLEKKSSFVYVKLLTPRVGPFLTSGIELEQSW